jgi:tRNA threonylcarbamoyladenosine biosynthesis protein TsaE
MSQNISYTLDQIDALAKEIISAYPYQCICLQGEMGSGKTSFCAAMARVLLLNDKVSSPTYAVINLYQNEKINVAHLDLFRLKNPQELLDIGFDDLIDEQDYLWIEWPEWALKLMPKPYLVLTFSKTDEHTRSIHISPVAV